MKSYRGIGMMTGTSMDGLDIVCCEFTELQEGFSFQLLAAECIPLEERWKSRLSDLYRQRAETYAKTDVFFGHWLGKQARDFIERHDLKPDFVAAHGQTIFHQPQKSFTAQIGDGETIASYLSCPVVTRFRNKDVALGGEGAPLVPFGEQYLFPGYQLFLNLGGIANLTYGRRAFDVAPCNLVLNSLAAAASEDLSYDPNGEIAASGRLLPELLAELDQIPYYRQRPPKSLGKEWVESVFMRHLRYHYPEPQDALRTVVEHITGQIATALRRMRVEPQEMLVTGGSYHNNFLMERLRAQLDPLGIAIATPPDPSVVDFKEAIIFAFLGLFCLLGKPNILPEVTGARVPVLGGSIHLPPTGGPALL